MVVSLVFFYVDTETRPHSNIEVWAVMICTQDLDLLADTYNTSMGTALLPMYPTFLSRSTSMLPHPPRRQPDQSTAGGVGGEEPFDISVQRRTLSACVLMLVITIPREYIEVVPILPPHHVLQQRPKFVFIIERWIEISRFVKPFPPHRLCQHLLVCPLRHGSFLSCCQMIALARAIPGVAPVNW